MILHAHHYQTGQHLRIEIRGEQIAEVEPVAGESRHQGDRLFVAPGFFDLQVNGYGGCWFSDENLCTDQLLPLLNSYFEHGVTRLFPTFITNTERALTAGVSLVRRACEALDWVHKLVPGFHLEGPFLSAEDGPRGAHAREFIRPCDWDEFLRLQTAAGGRIRLVTLAPESPGACEFIRRACDSGVRVALGHTAANSSQIAAAVEAGASLSTHLGNGCSLLLPRHPNPIWDQLGEPRLAASLISDGHHVPESFLRSVWFAKGGERTIITCDASGFAGLAPGIYPYQEREFEVHADGRVTLAGSSTGNNRGLLAGSSRLTDHCVSRMARATGCGLGAACDMAGRVPAQLCGLEAIDLCPGSRADLVLFSFADRLTVTTTLQAGLQKWTIDN